MPQETLDISERTFSIMISKPIEGAEIKFVDNRHNTLIANIITGKGAGEYSFRLPIGSLYNINIQSEGYVSAENEVVDLSLAYENDTLTRNFVLYPVELG